MRPRFRIRKFCPRPVHLLLLIFVFSPFIFALVFVFHRPHSSRDDDAAIPHVGTFRLVDDFLDEALHVSLSITQNYQDASGQPRRASPRGADAHPRASMYQFPLVSSTLQVDLDTLRAQACRILQGKSVFLVGPHETLYQLHSYLLTVLHPDPIPGSTIALTMRPACPGGTLSYSCPSHPLCYPAKIPPQSSFHSDSGSGSGSGSDTNYDYESPTLADIRSTNSSSSGGSSSSLLRFLNSGNLNPSPTQEDARLSSVPSVDPRTGARVIDSRWVRYAASSKADIIVLNRGPLPAPAWSYNKNNDSPAARNLTWLTTLRALEQKHAEPLSDLFLDVLSRLDHHHWHDDHDESAEPDFTKLVINAALHSTISTFLPSLLSTLSRLREHAGHRPILGTRPGKPVLWYGSWFLPVSCAPHSLSVFSSSKSDPRHLLARLLTQAEAMNNPWSAYYNAQGSYDQKTIGVHCLAPSC
jgi:hypothetical protein